MHLCVQYICTYNTLRGLGSGPHAGQNARTCAGGVSGVIWVSNTKKGSNVAHSRVASGAARVIRRSQESVAGARAVRVCARARVCVCVCVCV